MPKDWGRRVNRDPDITTVPEGFRDPDRFGRMRPEVNPYAGRIENNPILPGRSTPGANIGGGWNLYEGRPEPRNRWTPMNYQMEDQGFERGLGSLNNPFEETEQAALGWRTWQQLQRRFGTDRADELMDQHAVYDPNPFPGGPGGPLDPFPKPPWGDEFDVVERSSDFGSDWRGQQTLFDNIQAENPTLSPDELRRLFEEAMARATRIRT